jgi:hypothetical protein
MKPKQKNINLKKNQSKKITIKRMRIKSDRKKKTKGRWNCKKNNSKN